MSDPICIIRMNVLGTLSLVLLEHCSYILIETETIQIECDVTCKGVWLNIDTLR